MFYKVFLPALLLWATSAPAASVQTQCLIDQFRQFEASKPGLRDAPTETLPKSIDVISVSRPGATDDFNSAVKILRAHWNTDVIDSIREIAQRGAKGEILAEERVAANKTLKEARASLKNIRFLFEALDEGHEKPKALDEITTAIGKLRDVVQGKRGKPSDMSKYSKRVLKALKNGQLAQLEDEIANFTPDNREGFDQWFQKNLRQTKKLLQKKEPTAEDFHQVRKNLQMVLAVYRTELSLHPENEALWQPIIRFLTQNTERVGQSHEKWERKDAEGDFDYDQDDVELPPQLVKKILKFISSASV